MHSTFPFRVRVNPRSSALKLEPYPRLFAPHHYATISFPLVYPHPLFSLFIDFTEYMFRHIAVGSFGHFCAVFFFLDQPARSFLLILPPTPLIPYCIYILRLVPSTSGIILSVYVYRYWVRFWLRRGIVCTRILCAPNIYCF